MDLSRYLDPLKERLASLMEKLEPLLEKLEDLPYYPYSVIGIAAVILLLLVVLVVGRRRSSPPPKKSKPNRPRVTGLAVGLSSHDEFDEGYSHTGNFDYSTATPSRSTVPTTAPPVAVPPTTVAPIPTTPIARASEPPRSVVDPALEQVIKLCQGKFQGVYMEMYIELALVSNFDRLRTEVARRLKEDSETYRSISELGIAPEGVILMQLANVAGSMLQSGEHHTDKGQMNIHGQELLKVYRYALNAVREKGFASQAEIQSKLDLMEKKVQELGTRNPDAHGRGASRPE